MTLVFCPNDCGYFADFCPKDLGYSQIRPLWLPAAAGAITGGLAVSATYPLSEPDLYCWVGGVYCAFFALLIYAGVAGMAALIRGRRQLMDQYSPALVPGNQSDKRQR